MAWAWCRAGEKILDFEINMVKCSKQGSRKNECGVFALLFASFLLGSRFKTAGLATFEPPKDLRHRLASALLKACDVVYDLS